MTLVEVMLAVAVIVVAALGTLCYEYLCVDHVRMARAQLAATRVGQLLLEDWKSTGGADNYNPEDLRMGFEMPAEVPQGQFVTTIDDVPLHINMAMRDIAVDEDAGVTLREINVIVRWKSDFSSDTPGDGDPSVNLTTYVRRDG